MRELVSKLEPSGIPAIQHISISDFRLKSGKICPEVRLGYCVFADKPNLPVVVLHPALTGSPRAWMPNGLSSQGDGWFNRNIGSGKFLDTSKYCIVCVDPLGGNGHSLAATELQDYLEDLSFADGIALVINALKALKVAKVQAVIGGSIGGGQALEWLFQDEIQIERIFDISGSACRANTAREFFKITADVLDITAAQQEGAFAEKLTKRLLENCQDLLGSSRGFDLIFSKVSDNLKILQKAYDQMLALKIARQIGFLRFVTPKFYQSRLDAYREELGDDIKAEDKLLAWIEYQGESFTKRFSAQALRQLCLMDAKAKFHSPDLIAEALLNKGCQLIGFSVEGDTLFPMQVQKNFYELVLECLASEDRNKIHFISVKDELNGHDHFLTENFVKSAEMLKGFIG